MQFSGQKWLICPEQTFFGTNHYYYFRLPTSPCAKFKNILTVDPEFWGCTIFRSKMVHLAQFFFGKIVNIIFIYLLAPFIVQNFKKILTADPELRVCAIFWAQNGPFTQIKFFFTENLLISLVPFIHAYHHAKNQSQVLIYQWNIYN